MRVTPASLRAGRRLASLLLLALPLATASSRNASAQDATRQDATRQDATRQDATRQDATPLRVIRSTPDGGPPTVGFYSASPTVEVMVYDFGAVTITYRFA